MHETSFGNTIRDYLSGQEIDETTYEEFRQALAKLMVEEKGYPKERLEAKVDLCIVIDGEEECRQIDLVARDENGGPVLIVFFCAGEIGTFEREASIAALLFQGGPAPFALVTDTKSASLLEASSGECIGRGMQAIPHYDDLLDMAARANLAPPTPERREKLERIFHAYSGFVIGTCCNDACSLSPKK